MKLQVIGGSYEVSLYMCPSAFEHHTAELQTITSTPSHLFALNGLRPLACIAADKKSLLITKDPRHRILFWPSPPASPTSD